MDILMTAHGRFSAIFAFAAIPHKTIIYGVLDLAMDY
jgi:hypothetical protein